MEIRALAAAVEAADAHGLLRGLAERPLPAVGAARAHGLDPVACERVLEVLRAGGVVEREGERYRLSGPIIRELDGPLSEPGQSARFWSLATHFLKSGEPLLAPEQSTGRGPVYREAVPELARLFERPAASLAARLAPLLGEGRVEVVDVGAGSGVWSLALLQALPGARATAVDLPDVLPRFLERARHLGVEDRVSTVAGDYQEARVAPTANVVVLANVLHLEPALSSRRLLERWAGALVSGGHLVVVDALSHDGSEPAHAAYALHLAMRLPGGYPHLEPDLRGWMVAAGCGPVERIPLDEELSLLGALVARKG